MTPTTPAMALDPTERAPHLNALKHGLRSQTLVLPGEDGVEFQRMRRDLYAHYRPRTGNEARCVEAMANHEWVMERCRRLRDGYYARIQAVLNGEDQHCEADPHRWHHKAIDCTLEEGRLQRHQERERRKLAELQKLRVQRLLAGLDADEAPAWGDPAAANAGADGEEVREKLAATDSNDAGNGKPSKRDGGSRLPPRPANPDWEIAVTPGASHGDDSSGHCPGRGSAQPQLDFPSPAA